MTDDKVGRTRRGGASKAHSSARRQAAVNVDKIPSRAKGKAVSTTMDEPRPEDAESQEENEDVEENISEEGEEEGEEGEEGVDEEAEEADEEADEEGDDDGEEEVDEEAEEEMEEEEEAEQPPPEPKKPRKKVTRVTQGRNPPRVKPPPVTCYDGGPSDLSLLPGFGKHVAVPLWKGELQSRYLRVMNNGKKINNFKICPKEYSWFWNVVNASGLETLRRTNYNHTDWGLLTAFAERWHPETGTFHLPIGEMTITLDDVSSLLHIPITGKMLDHNGTSCTKEDGEEMCVEYLNFPISKCKKEFQKMKGAHIGFKALKDLYLDNLKDALKAERLKKPAEDVEFLRECTIRCYLLYLIGATIFTNKSMQYVDVIFLTYLRDLSLVNTWNWGASGLAYLYNYLDAASRPRCGNHGGYNCLFQAWIMAHFKTFGGRFVDERYTHDNPYAARFLPLKGPKFPGQHRSALDTMRMDEVVFCPYEEHRQTRPFQDISWYTGWIMCGSAIINPHLPERVLRQFGHVQSIPRHPDVSAKAGMNRFTIADAFASYLTANYVTEEMRGPKVVRAFDTVPGYIPWLYRVSHPKILPPVEADPPTHANLEEDNVSGECDVSEVTKKVRADLRKALDGQLNLADALVVIEKAYTDLEPVDAYLVRRKRKRDSGEGTKKRKKKKKTTTEDAGTSSL
ncbi:protein MAIN-LIKE 1-like isoform X2 [Trifolium pratense]|uniref:Uncharacterized protein n=2 Tax=Trifolium pratense TaxID=57577 RepID=A0ACB0JSU2_TRIPR|nr:protein MAIN-LIKE 1-like isoform X2 [Trifolium pratense]XP_045816366.1 protein MAIN-LIKE 1-like [Trifolium pratense]XP_045816367.1 protein MAIN-LIKE 1-like [Trifolium pratense]XP_045817146.1 protein MAIN-LIKE 1-like [Trifolium pratense]XP_045821782.1 protein MAIN-LIKE 1-like isoform X2 [Trifolium pratense]CAJ2646660.1 unnamed protein product [Trifolium pratense]CAJ2665398.1 unnamed protein product [Trifolium pratense]